MEEVQRGNFPEYMGAKSIISMRDNMVERMGIGTYARLNLTVGHRGRTSHHKQIARGCA